MGAIASPLSVKMDQLRTRVEVPKARRFFAGFFVDKETRNGIVSVSPLGVNPFPRYFLAQCLILCQGLHLCTESPPHPSTGSLAAQSRRKTLRAQNCAISCFNSTTEILTPTKFLPRNEMSASSTR